MKPLLLALLLLFPLVCAAQNPKPPAELLRLRDEYVEVTKDVKASLRKLLPFYEMDVVKANEKLALSKTALSEGTASPDQVEKNEKTLAVAQQKLVEIFAQITKADQDIAEALDDAKFFKGYKEAVQQRRRSRKPRCASWTVTASQRTTSNSVAYSYRFVCQ
jgi:hypothetical protein